MNILEFRKRYPQYDDMSDGELGGRLHKKHYSDIPKKDFDAKFIAPVYPKPEVDVYGGVDPKDVIAQRAERRAFNTYMKEGDFRGMEAPERPVFDSRATIEAQPEVSYGIKPEAPVRERGVEPTVQSGVDPSTGQPRFAEGAGVGERLWPFGTVQDPATRARAEAETAGRPPLTMGEKTAGLEQPWIDPVAVAVPAGAVTGILAKRAGVKGAELAGRVLTSAFTAGGAEYPIGMVTEKIGEKHPELAPYVNIGLGILSGVTVEHAIERAVAKKIGKVTGNAVKQVGEALQKGDFTEPVTREVYKDIAEEAGVAKKPMEAIEKTEPTPTIPKAKKVAPVAPERPLKVVPEKKIKPGEAKRARILQAEKELAEPVSAIPDAIKQPYAEGAKVKIGRSPQVNTITKEIEATAAEKKLGERFFEIKNDKTGETNVVSFEELKPIKVKERIGRLLREEKGEIRLEPEEPEFTGRAKEVWEGIKESRESARQIKRNTPAKVYKALKGAVVDVSGNVKKDLLKKGPEGKKAVMQRDLIAGASTKALKDVDEATNKIYKGLDSKEHDLFDSFIMAKRHLEIKKKRPKFKFPKGQTVEHYEDIINQIPKEIRPKVERAAKVYWGEMENQLGQLRKEGLLTKESYDALREQGQYYSPRQVLEYIDEGSTYGSKKITVPDSGIKKLSDEGSDKLIETDTSLLLSQVIERTQARIFRNRANKAMYGLAELQPDNGIVKIAKIVKMTKAGKPVYQQAPHGWEKISVMMKGQKKELLMPKEYAEEWIKSDPILTHTQANAAQWILGGKILRPMATGLNPEFALTNFPRDLAHIWLTTEEYSKHGPMATLQMGKDLVDVMKDAFTRKGAWQDYINEGGGMEFLTHQGRFAPKIKGRLGQLQNVMGYLGETSEILGRLALRNRALKQGKSATEATWIARNYLDFSQGGSVTKAVDNAIPYLNASIQGTRGIVRMAANKPAEFSYKIAQMGVLATGLYYANFYNNPEALAQISAREKTNNWIVTTPFSYTDKDGNKKWIYFKIAKDQGQRAFTSVFEGLAAKAIGEEVDVDQITTSAQDFIPLLPTGLLPPTAAAFIGYAANKDFWMNEDIWRGPKVLPKEEYNRYTPEVYKKAGEITGLSPDRLKYGMERYFTHGNVWTSLVGYGMKQMLDEMPEKERGLVTEELILRQPFIRKIARHTDPYHKYGKEAEEIKIAAQTERYKRTRELDNLTQRFFDESITRKDVMDYIKKQPIMDKERLQNRFRASQKLEKIPNRGYWLTLLNMPPEARATAFWNRWRVADKTERKALLKTSLRVQGFRGDKFNYQFSQLKRKYEQEEKK